VPRAVADYAKMLAQPRFAHHRGSVAADALRPVYFKDVAVVELVGVRASVDRAQVDRGLAIVLAKRLQAAHLEATVRDREESRRADQCLQLRIPHGDGRTRDLARIRETDLAAETDKVLRRNSNHDVLRGEVQLAHYARRRPAFQGWLHPHLLVQSPANALAKECFMSANVIRQAAVAVDVRKVELACKKQ